ncbi:hypothetical protein HID58_025785, partial [Brassica napus]
KMGRAPCCDKTKVKRGPWSPEEDAKLRDYIEKYGNGGNWISLPLKAGLRRCGKSCRLRPNIKHGDFSEEEDRIIFSLFAAIGSRTDNDIKNYWNTKLRKKIMSSSSSSSSHSSAAMATPFLNPNSHDVKRPITPSATIAPFFLQSQPHQFLLRCQWKAIRDYDEAREMMMIDHHIDQMTKGTMAISHKGITITTLMDMGI